MSEILQQINFAKVNGLVPAIIQDVLTGKVLMLGYMNKEALQKTISENKVTFYSRTKERLWTKGETSGNLFHVKEINLDCDQDTLLIKVVPEGPACHTGDETCFHHQSSGNAGFLNHLKSVIKDRKNNPNDSSYTSSLFKKGINKVAQKVGEEAVELVIEAKDDNPELFKNEAADLMYHYMVLLEAKDVDLDVIMEVLMERHLGNK